MSQGEGATWPVMGEGSGLTLQEPSLLADALAFCFLQPEAHKVDEPWRLSEVPPALLGPVPEAGLACGGVSRPDTRCLSVTNALYFSGKLQLCLLEVVSEQNGQTILSPQKQGTGRKLKGRAVCEPGCPGGLVLWGQKFWKTIPQARHVSLEVFQLEGRCRFQVLLGSGEVGRVGATGVWRIDDIGVYLNGGIEPKFRFDPAHGQIVLERTSKSQPEVAAQNRCLRSSRRHGTFACALGLSLTGAE